MAPEIRIEGMSREEVNAPTVYGIESPDGVKNVCQKLPGCAIYSSHDEQCPLYKEPEYDKYLTREYLAAEESSRVDF